MHQPIDYPALPRRAAVMQCAPLKFVLLERFNPGIEELRDITVPQGFITDFYSIPRVLWAIYPPHLMPIEASIIHDWGYAMGLKDISDDFLYIAMRAYGAPKHRARLFATAVKKFGSANRSREAYLANPKQRMSAKEIEALKEGFIVT